MTSSTERTDLADCTATELLQLYQSGAEFGHITLRFGEVQIAAVRT